jgi:hypothetical protein
MIRGRKVAPGIVVVAGVTLAACIGDPVTPPTAASRNLKPLLSTSAGTAASPESQLAALMDEANARLEAAGANTRFALAEYLTSGDGGIAGGTVIAKNVGNKQLAGDFVPFDLRRAPWSGVSASSDDITYAIDRHPFDGVPSGGLVTEPAASAAIQRSMATWNGANCSTLPIGELNAGTGNLGWLIGATLLPVADVTHAGWRQVDFAGGVLAATFTIIFIQPNGAPTDIDNNGLADVAAREIYYDPSWTWRINGNIDVETVALHEAGHALSQNHFGTISLLEDGSLMASPRAVMNAFYGGPLHTLLGTDNGGHCSLWSLWPAE